jgi:hypothetical protein
LQAALASYRDALSLAMGLAQSDPNNSEWQRDVAVNYAKLARLHQQAGDRGHALDAFREGRAIMERVVRRSPEYAAWKQDLTWFDSQIVSLEK